MKRDIGISYARVIAMIFILTDHIVMTIDIPFKAYIIQITNTGVLSFLFISSFLYGRKEIGNFKEWFIKRVKKIIIPLYVFMIFLAIMKIIFLDGINLIEFFKYFINMQGILGVTDGAVHLWFLTVLMLCYLITPLLSKIKRKLINIRKLSIILIISFCIFVQVFCAYFINISFALGHPFSTYLIYLFVYIIGYYYSYFVEDKEINNKKIVIFTSIMDISMITRVVCNKLMDGSVFYDRIMAMYTNALFAIWIVIFIKKYYKNISFYYLKKIVNNLDVLSFEIYILHPLLIDIFMNFSSNLFINISFTLIGTYIIAILFKKICDFINKLLFVVKI